MDDGKKQFGQTRCRDRLSDLPEPILYHILSFLNTKSAVQTSVLSRLWRCAWKHVPVLNFYQGHFRRYSSFCRYVDKVLSLRYRLNLCKVSFVDDEPGLVGSRNDFLASKVIQYALSCDVQHLVIATETDLESTSDTYGFSDLFGWFASCNLKTLELSGFHLDGGFGSPLFRMLTTLDLEACLAACGDDEKMVFEPFSNFPCLKHLAVVGCRPCETSRQRCIKIRGLELLSLKLVCAEFDVIDIDAPKLEFFSSLDRLDYVRLSDLSLPSLDRAEIGFYKEKGLHEEEKELIMHRLIALFPCLHNAKSLKLGEGTLQVMSVFCGVWEDQPSPFTRLESLILDSESVPYELVDYFLKGSSASPNVEFIQP